MVGLTHKVNPLLNYPAIFFSKPLPRIPTPFGFFGLGQAHRHVVGA
jgi:hypothetical protein